SLPELSTLSLHDALPICAGQDQAEAVPVGGDAAHGPVRERRNEDPGAGYSLEHAAESHRSRWIEKALGLTVVSHQARVLGEHLRSEEHTSELQSRENLVC